MEGKYANPLPLGLMGFAMTTWLLSMVNVGWFDEKSMSLVLAMALVYGGVTQGLAGILAYLRGNTFATVAFLSYGAFWVSLVAFFKVFGGAAPAPFLGWYLFVWGVFSFGMWIATFRHSMALQLVFLTLWMAFLLLAVGAWFNLAPAHVLGGYMGMINALLAAYLAFAEMINGDYGRAALPTGPYLK